MSPRLRFVVRRTLLVVPVLGVMSVFVFLLIRLVPGDPVRTMLGFRATPENVAVVRARLGLDRPLVEQYWTWLTGALHGDLGRDVVSGAPLTELLAQRLPVTLELAVTSLLLALLVGVPLGIQAAAHRGWTARLTDGFVVLGVSIPDFWLGIMLVLLFSATLGVLPPSGWVPFTQDPAGNLRYLVLPAVTLATAEAAYFLRTTRAAIETVMAQPFVELLRAKGVRPRRILYVHALRNAATPIITVAGVQFGVLLGGAIIVETLFAVPGVGRLIVTAITQRNYPVVQAGVLVVATLFIVVSLLADVLVGLVDPRVAERSAS